MSEPALKCENSASFKQSYTLKLFIAFKIAYSCCLSSGGNLDFPDFLQKSFITSTTGLALVWNETRIGFISRYSFFHVSIQNNETSIAKKCSPAGACSTFKQLQEN